MSKKKEPKHLNGEGSVRYKTETLVEGRAMINGENIYVYVKAKPKGDAVGESKEEKEARKMLKKAILLAEQTGVIDSHMRLQEWMLKWVELRKNKKKLRPKTHGDYISLISTHITDSKIGRKEIAKLTIVELENYYLDKLNFGRIQKKLDSEDTSLSLGTIKKIHALIRASLNEAVRLDMISRNVAERVELPEEEVEYNEFGEVDDVNDYCAFSPLERIAFLEKAQTSVLYSALLSMMYTGVRVGEALALKWRNLDLDKGELHVRETLQRVKTPDGPQKTKLVVGPPKTYAGRRTIPLPSIVVDELIKHREEQKKTKEKWGEAYQDKDIVFCIENGNYREPRNFTRSFYIIRNNSGVSPINLHGIRHTYCTMLLENKVDLKTVSILMGHSDILVTINTYGHVFPEIKSQAVAELNDYTTTRIKNIFKVDSLTQE